ncbi:MAG: TraR/DksA C4-type zinc finger protein [Phycisphaerae bacterium]|nr:TraR/DksA C4-type zinc finger protein [Phycisphaerae bacterium]
MQKAPAKKRAKRKAAAPSNSSSFDRDRFEEPVEDKPPKSPLKKRELEVFRALLLAKRATLVGDVTNMTDEALRQDRQTSSGDLSNMPIHMADLGSDNFEQEFTLGLIENSHAVLREIDEALQRIDEGGYGVCLGTGRPISKARLKAKPWAKYCIEYARKLERGY